MLLPTNQKISEIEVFKYFSSETSIYECESEPLIVAIHEFSALIVHRLHICESLVAVGVVVHIEKNRE